MRDAIARARAHAGSPLFRNAYALLINQGANSVLGIAFWVLAARLYAPDAVGRNAALLAMMQFLALLSQLGLRQAMIWILPLAGPAAGRHIARAYVMSACLSLVLAPMALLALDGSEATSMVGSSDVRFIAWFTLATVMSSLFGLSDGVLVGIRRATWVPFGNAAFGVLKLGLLPILVLVFAGIGIFAAWTIALAPMVVIVNVLVFRRLGRRSNRDEEGVSRVGKTLEVARFVGGDFVGHLLIQGVPRLLPILVVAILGAAANAYSFQAWTVVLPVFAVAGAMMSSLTVESLTRPERAADYSRRMLRNMVRLLVPVSVLLTVAAPMVLLLFGEAYAREATTLLRLLSLSIVPITLNVWYYALCRIRGTVAPIIILQAGVAALSLGSSFVLLPVVGIDASAIGWLLGQSLVAAYVVAREFRWERGRGLQWPRGGVGRVSAR